jgi:hypothetical protein
MRIVKYINRYQIKLLESPSELIAKIGLKSQRSDEDIVRQLLSDQTGLEQSYQNDNYYLEFVEKVSADQKALGLKIFNLITLYLPKIDEKTLLKVVLDFENEELEDILKIKKLLKI